MTFSFSCSYSGAYNFGNNYNNYLNNNASNNNDNFGNWVMGGLQNQGIYPSGNPGNDLNALLSSIMNPNNLGLNGFGNNDNLIQGQNSNQQQDRAILGAFKAFGVRPTGNKQQDMQTFLNKLREKGANGSFNAQQGQAISRLMDVMGVNKTGDRNADLGTLANKLQNLGNGSQNIGNPSPPPPPPPPPPIQGSTCGSQNGNQAETAILGAFKAFGVQPTGNKDQDMQTFLNKLRETGANGGFNAQQGEAISRLMDVLGVEKTGDKNADLEKLPQALMNIKN